MRSCRQSLLSTWQRCAFHMLCTLRALFVHCLLFGSSPWFRLQPCGACFFASGAERIEAGGRGAWARLPL